MSHPPSPAALLLGSVAGAMAPAPPLLPAQGTTLAEAVAALAAARSSAVLAVDGGGRPVGILTEQDVARRVTFRLPPETPLAAAMTAPVIACGASDGLWRAVALMRAHHLRHLPVLGPDGAPIGMLHRAETLAAASGRLLGHLDALGAAEDAAVKRAQAGVAAALLAEGVPAPEVVALVGEVNLDLHRRVAMRALAAQQGPPPVGFTLLVMGSAGRGESLLRPDQDNALILGGYGDAEHDRIDAWFRGFAEALNTGLDAAGFPLCPGGVMARNPLWRKRLPEWEAQFALWARRRSGAALLFADIAFDFRACASIDSAGRLAAADAAPAAPAARLRLTLTRLLAEVPALLAALAQQNAALRVGLTFWGGFADDEPGAGARTDLKLHGLMPLVAAARLAALQRGVAETGTVARLDGLAAAGTITAGEAARLREAFGVLLGAVLRQQLEDAAAGRTPGNLVDTASLRREERVRLRDALRAVRGFAGTTIAGFTGQLW
ncbi:MAG: CBS domain-containing protein [Acetobacteraceae bacterium]|nr:CBS domain-containing protein [Acetobacteraceae bacterium]